MSSTSSSSSEEDSPQSKAFDKKMSNDISSVIDSPTGTPSGEVVKIRVSSQDNYNPINPISDRKVFTEDVDQTNNLPQIIHSIKQKGPLPGLVIAVVGDSESFVPRPWNSMGFTSGLIQTVSGAKDSWIIYRGKEDGVSSLIMNAFKKDSSSKQEATSFEFTKNKTKKEKKIKNKDDSKTKKEMKTKEEWVTKLIALKHFSEKSSIKTKNEEDMWTFYLEPVYSSQYESQKEDFQHEWYNDYLSRLLETVSKMYTTLLKKGTGVLLNMRVPVLLIVVEGDITTIEQVRSAVKRKVPVLLVKGSGKAANLIADYLSETGESEREKLLKEKAPLLFGIYLEKDKFYDLMRTMKEIGKLHYMITIFDVDNSIGQKMEDAVVEAIIKGWSLEELDKIQDCSATELDSSDPPQVVNPTHGSETIGQLKSKDGKKDRTRQTITCKVVTEGEQYQHKDGIMEHYQFTLTPGSLSLYFYIAYQFIQEVSGNSKGDLELLLLEAIIADRVDYVSAMMQNGVQFDRMYMDRLYEETLKCPGCDGKDCRSIHAIHYRTDEESCRQIWKTSTKKSSKAKNNSQICKYIARTFCQQFLNYPKEDISPNENDKSQKSKPRKSSVIHPDTPNNSNEQQTNDESDSVSTYHDLLAWALFANRMELAGVFWTKCKNQLLTAVMASSILKNMAENVEAAKDRKLHEELIHHSKLFEDRVLAMQNSLYEEEEIECMGLMQTYDNIWGIKVSPMECAYDNDMMDVIGHPCVQRLLNNIWYNKSAVKWTQWMKSLFKCKTWKKASLSPLMGFTVHYIFMLALIVCFSAFILTNIPILREITDVGVYEWLLYVWLCGDLVEEVLRNSVLAITRGGHTRFRLFVYITNFWNLLTVLSYIIIASAILVRIFVSSDEYHRMEIRLYSFGLFTIYMRFLQSMLVLGYFGPKIIMIGKMLGELIKIGWLLVVFIMCTGVLYHANMFPSHYDMWSLHGATYWRIWKIVSLPYWQIYGELSLDNIKGENDVVGVSCTNNETIWEDNPDMERCVEYDWSLMVIAAIYMLITNLLLVNLVIALFSYRFEEVQNNSDRLWKFWRYSIITDFQTRFPVPFNLIIRLFHTPIAICREKKTERNVMEKQQPLHAVQCLYEEKIKK